VFLFFFAVSFEMRRWLTGFFLAFVRVAGYWLGSSRPSSLAAPTAETAEDHSRARLDALCEQLCAVSPRRTAPQQSQLELELRGGAAQQHALWSFFTEQHAKEEAMDAFLQWVWLLGRSHARAVLSGLRMAETEFSSSSPLVSASTPLLLTTSSALFRDELVRLALHAGYSGHFDSARNNDGGCLWRVRCTDAPELAEPVLLSARDVRVLPSAAYKGRTWCVTIPSGFIFTRRAVRAAPTESAADMTAGDSVVTRASRPVIVGNCSQEHQKQHWPVHRATCASPTPEQDAAREQAERRAAQEAMLGANGRTKLIMPVKVKGEHAAAAHGDDDEVEEGIEEVDSLVSLKCPLSLERYEFPARGKHCAHLPCFNLETFLMFSQQSGVWQCPVCYKPLPWEDLEVDLNMLSVIRETADRDPEVTQIRVGTDGQYDIVSNEKGAGDETGDGRDPSDRSRKRKQPSASPTPGATNNTAVPPPAQRQALGQAATEVSVAAMKRSAILLGPRRFDWARLLTVFVF
jgi:hypothetical protein